MRKEAASLSGPVRHIQAAVKQVGQVERASETSESEQRTSVDNCVQVLGENRTRTVFSELANEPRSHGRRPESRQGATSTYYSGRSRLESPSPLMHARLDDLPDTVTFGNESSRKGDIY